MTDSKTLNVTLSAEEAINLLLLLNRECELYTHGSAAPARIVDLRAVVSKLDSSLDDLFGYETSGK